MRDTDTDNKNTHQAAVGPRAAAVRGRAGSPARGASPRAAATESVAEHDNTTK